MERPQHFGNNTRVRYATLAALSTPSATRNASCDMCLVIISPCFFMMIFRVVLETVIALGVS